LEKTKVLKPEGEGRGTAFRDQENAIRKKNQSHALVSRTSCGERGLGVLLGNEVHARKENQKPSSYYLKKRTRERFEGRGTRVWI